MKTIRHSIAAAALAGFATALTVPAAVAGEVRIVVGQPGDGPFQAGVEKFAAAIEEKTSGEYTGTVYKGSLLSYPETLEGLASGVADVGFLVPIYHRGEFPTVSYLTDIVTTIVEPTVLGGAMSEFIFTCDECLNEYKVQNQVFTGVAINGPYRLMVTKEISDVEELKGTKIRGVGAFNRLIDSWGATSVSLTANDIHEALSRGQLDGDIHIWNVVNKLSLGDYVEAVYDLPIGLYAGCTPFDTNLDFWRSLSEGNQRKFLEAAAEATAFTTIAYFSNEEALAAKADELNVKNISPPETLHKSITDFQAENIKFVINQAVESGEIPDAQAKADRMMELIEKWRGLLADVDKRDAVAVAAVYKAELYDGLDLSKLQ